MNLSYVFLIGIILILFIMAGDNPFAPPEGYVPPDEFKEDIKATIEKPDGLGAGSPLGLMGSGPPGSGEFGGFNPNLNNPNAGMGMGTYGYPTEPYQPNYDTLGGSNSPNNNDMIMRPSPIRTVPNRQPVQQNNNVPTPFQNLPGAGSSDNSGGSVNDDMSLSYLGLPVPYTDKGHPVGFQGATVVTLNKTGQKVPMPDGVYQLSDGSEIIVRDGRNIFPKDGNEFH